MKAWQVGEASLIWRIFTDWTILIHANTREQARKIARDVWPEQHTPDYINIRAIRVPEVDNKPFTYENLPDGLFKDDEEYPLKDYWYNFCACEICTKH